MTTKMILRFYFSAESLNRALDNLILKKAVGTAHGTQDTERSFAEIAAIISEKEELKQLWGKLDCIMRGLRKGDIDMLEGYAALRTGAGEGERRREIKRAVTKFCRHAQSHGGFGELTSALKKYCCLMRF